jgi:hypothetical protein
MASYGTAGFKSHPTEGSSFSQLFERLRQARDLHLHSAINVEGIREVWNSFILNNPPIELVLRRLAENARKTYSSQSDEESFKAEDETEQKLREEDLQYFRETGLPLCVEFFDPVFGERSQYLSVRTLVSDISLSCFYGFTESEKIVAKRLVKRLRELIAEPANVTPDCLKSLQYDNDFLKLVGRQLTWAEKFELSLLLQGVSDGPNFVSALGYKTDTTKVQEVVRTILADGPVVAADEISPGAMKLKSILYSLTQSERLAVISGLPDKHQFFCAFIASVSGLKRTPTSPVNIPPKVDAGEEGVSGSAETAYLSNGAYSSSDDDVDGSRSGSDSPGRHSFDQTDDSLFFANK